MTTSTEAKRETTGIGVIFGMWTRYEVVDAEAEDFFSRYDVEDYTDIAFPLQVILWDDVLTEIDADSFSYPAYPAEWTKGVACLEASHAYFEVDGLVKSVDEIGINNVNITYNGEEYEAEDWDMQEVESAIDIVTKKEVDLYV
jgi:hypothetical protein